jgi:hypothetical protein
MTVHRCGPLYYDAKVTQIRQVLCDPGRVERWAKFARSVFGDQLSLCPIFGQVRTTASFCGFLFIGQYVVFLNSRCVVHTGV